MRKNFNQGKIIVFEGIDGAGAETQTKLLFNYLKKAKKPVVRLCYPDKGGPIGKLIHQYLHQKYDFPVETQFLLYTLDFLKDKEKIKKLKEKRKIIIIDRYFTSTLAYQGLRGFSLKKALKFADIFSLPKPDLIIYLKIFPQTSIKRKYKEKRSLDRNERDEKLLSQLVKSYDRLIKNKIFGKWVIVNGEKPIEEVFADIKKILKL